MLGNEAKNRGEVAATWSASLEDANYYLGLLDALGLMGLPGMVLSPECKKLAANAQFQSLWKCARSASAYFSFSDSDSDQKLADALAQVIIPEQVAWPITIAVHNTENNLPMAIYVWAVRSPGQREYVALISAHRFGKRRGPAEELLRAMFGLTPAEARVARSIGEGEAIGSIAKKAALSRETIRTQLASVLSKTGTRRQIDLALRVANLGLP